MHFYLDTSTTIVCIFFLMEEHKHKEPLRLVIQDAEVRCVNAKAFAQGFCG